MSFGSVGRQLVVACAAVSMACAPPVSTPATPAAPRYPDYPEPIAPAAVLATPELRSRHQAAWAQLQRGETGAAGRAFAAIVKVSPAFYPAEAGLGFARLAERQFAQAADRFTAAVRANDAYLPAWVGLAEAHVALDHDAEAIAALERVVALDPARSSARARLDLLRFRRLPTLIALGQGARRAGDMGLAREHLSQALKLAPSSGVILRELALVELDAGDIPAAVRQARRAVAVDATDARSHETLAVAFEAGGNTRGAAEAYERAYAIDPRPEWKERATALRGRSELAAIPGEFRAVPTAASLTRAQVAAYVGIRLETLINRAPPRPVDVATDIRNHWAGAWILPVTRAGVMEILPNHTFQPSAVVRRGDLAAIVSRIIALIPQRQMDLTRWRSARPRFADLPPTHVFYAAAAMSVSAGAMTADAASRFRAIEPATGPDLVAAVARIEQIAGR